ncbi:MAG TPA: alanine racemase, partial [Candidatus Limnocylindrales bacterium]|nr:alanine racemase [Candidatus Limnocylindrales bacterium]
MTELSFPALPSGLDTPRVVVDLARVEANIDRLQRSMDERGIALRPHAKTHKSVAIARLQVAAGARGITVGTIGEAEVFAAAGIDDLFLAYPVWADGDKAIRLRALADTGIFAVGVDSVAGAESLGAALAGAGRPLRVLVEVDPGLRRTGVATPEE